MDDPDPLLSTGIRFSDQFCYNQRHDYLSLTKSYLRKEISVNAFVYCHQIDLAMEILVDRVPCPLQTDPNKFARTDCSAVTDRGMNSVLEKIVDISSHMGKDLIIAEGPMEFFPQERALHYIQPSTGATPYFHLEKNGEFQFWSAMKFTKNQLTDFLKDPQTVVRPPFNNKFNQNEL